MTRVISSIKKFLTSNAPAPNTVAAIVGLTAVTIGLSMLFGFPVALTIFGAFTLIPVMIRMFTKRDGR